MPKNYQIDKSGIQNRKHEICRKTNVKSIDKKKLKFMMSVILTIASLGTRVALAYLLSATPLGVTGIWLSVPIGWALADAIGIGYYLKTKTA